MIIHLIKYQKLLSTCLYFSIRIIFLSYFIFGFTQNNYSQTYPFRHFTVEDGLPSSEIYHIFQDSKGYIWFASDNGVSRYDGYEFRNFTHNEGLPDNTVFEIFEDYKNRIWFIPHSAKLSYYYRDSIFEYRYNDSLQNAMKINANPIKLSFYVDSTDQVFYGDKLNGSYIIDSLGSIKRISTKANSKFIFLITDHKLITDIGNFTRRNLTSNILNISRNKEILFNLPLQDTIKKYFTLPPLAILKDKDIYIALDKSVLHIEDISALSVKVLPDQIIWLSKDVSSRLWVGTRNGVYCYSNLDANNKPNYHLLKNKNVSSILQDKEGGHWFSTLYDGVYYLPGLNITTITKKDGLPGENINSLTSDSKYLWLGLGNKIARMQSNKINKVISLDESNVIIGKLFFDTNSHKLWIASQFLYSYNDSNLNRLNLLMKDGRISYKVQPKDIILDNQKNTWIATSGGLHKFNEEKKLGVRMGGFYNKINSVCLKLKSDFLLCGCNNGLYEYSIIDDTFKYLGTNNQQLSVQVNCIINNDFHNNYWIGTKTNGIVVYGYDSTYTISVKDGLTSNSITSLFQKKNVIWATTINGLNKITLNARNFKKSYSISTYNTIHGITSPELNDIYVNDSLAYVAAKKGLSVLDYHNIEPNTLPPPIHIKKIRIEYTDTLIQSRYDLPYYKNSIYIEYVGLMYRNHENKKYKYQLNQPGKQSKWIETTDNYINFSSLSPGEYNFKVIAINEDGYESNIPATLEFTINPPYWKTGWFFSLLIFGIIIFITGILLIIYFVKVSEIKRRNALERKLLLEINRFRQQALSQQMNPHFIFNTLNSIQFYIYDNDINSSTQYLSKFSKLMRVILNNSQHDTIPIQKELEAMQLYLELESMRLDNQLNYEISTNDVDVESYQIHPLLIQPYVENSIWHGLVHKEGEKNVKIEIRNNKDSILCIIEDDGIGRQQAMEIKKKKNKRHISYGTNITGKRIDSINKLFNQDFKVEYIDLKDDNGNACGTKVLLQIPKISN